MRFTSVILISFLFFQCVSAEETNTLSLNGQWEIIFDDDNSGYEKGFYKTDVFEKESSKKAITIPSCWEEIEKDYEGVAFYRRSFFVPKGWKGKIVHINFDAVNYKSELWINDQVVGFHEGGYTPFSLRIDRLLKAGEENILTMRVVSPIILTDKRIDDMGRQEVPMWRGAITGGIWQSVNITATDNVRLADVFIEPNVEKQSATLNLDLNSYEKLDKAGEIKLEILDSEGKTVANKTDQIDFLPGKNAKSYELAIPNAQNWDVENPYLYTAKVSVAIDGATSDQWQHKFGLREFAVKDGKFVMNDKPLYLKATFFEGLYPVKLAYPDSREMAIKEIVLAKEAGFNMIRPWRKPPPPMWLDLCDSIGMMTVGSLVVECMKRPISSPYLAHRVENELIESVKKDRNRTCVVQWELFNEINRPILAQMLHSSSLLARELDPTRLILDESGGWGEGAKVYNPYSRTPIVYNDIHHYAGSQITEEIYNEYTIVGKTKEEIAAIGFDGMKVPGDNVVPGAMSFISELGYGSMPDVVDNNKDFKAKGNPIVAPTVYHARLEKEMSEALAHTGFDAVYPDLKKFALEQQLMHGLANKRQIEAIRTNPNIAGYCVHALVGGDWVLGAGLLDLWRNPKTEVYDMTKAATQPQILTLRVMPRNIYAANGAKLTVKGINELEKEDAQLQLVVKTAKGKKVYSKTVKAEFAHGITDLLAEDLTTDKMSGAYVVEANLLDAKGKTITSNTTSFDVFSAKDITLPKANIAVIDPNQSLASFFDKRGIAYESFSNKIPSSALVVVGKVNKKDKEAKQQIAELKKWVDKGGKAILLDVAGKPFPSFDRELPVVEVEALPFGAHLYGKWNTLGAWSGRPHIVKKHPVFKGLPTEQIMHGVYENIHPKTSMMMQKGEYIAGIMGYDHFPNQDIMVRHYNGIGDVFYGADVMTTPWGNGEMLFSTMDIITHLGKDPAAEKLLFNMIEFMKK